MWKNYFRKSYRVNRVRECFKTVCVEDPRLMTTSSYLVEKMSDMLATDIVFFCWYFILFELLTNYS